MGLAGAQLLVTGPHTCKYMPGQAGRQAGRQAGYSAPTGCAARQFSVVDVVFPAVMRCIRHTQLIPRRTRDEHRKGRAIGPARVQASRSGRIDNTFSLTSGGCFIPQRVMMMAKKRYRNPSSYGNGEGRARGGGGGDRERLSPVRLLPSCSARLCCCTSSPSTADGVRCYPVRAC